jgi:hypothetical protein
VFNSDGRYEDILFFKPWLRCHPMYINFVKSYAQSSQLYVLGFCNVCCNLGRPS